MCHTKTGHTCRKKTQSAIPAAYETAASACCWTDCCMTGSGAITRPSRCCCRPTLLWPPWRRRPLHSRAVGWCCCSAPCSGRLRRTPWPQSELPLLSPCEWPMQVLASPWPQPVLQAWPCGCQQRQCRSSPDRAFINSPRPLKQSDKLSSYNFHRV